MRKIFIVLILTLFFAITATETVKALSMGQVAPDKNSYLVLKDGGSTQKDWYIWADSTNEVLRCSSCSANGGAECPNETPFDETDGQIIGTQS